MTSRKKYPFPQNKVGRVGRMVEPHPDMEQPGGPPQEETEKGCYGEGWMEYPSFSPLQIGFWIHGWKWKDEQMNPGSNFWSSSNGHLRVSLKASKPPKTFLSFLCWNVFIGEIPTLRKIWFWNLNLKTLHPSKVNKHKALLTKTSTPSTETKVMARRTKQGKENWQQHPLLCWIVMPRD